MNQRKIDKRTARKNYERDVLDLASVTHNEISTILTRFQNKAFNLAIKHSETIKEIKNGE